MLPSIGQTETILLVVALLMLFGAKRIPGLARSLGSGVREFRDGISGEPVHREMGSGGGKDWSPRAEGGSEEADAEALAARGA